jgi:tRNA(fMet)-specific endonuclease VapC
MKWLLDTNTLSVFARRRSAGLVKRLDEHLADCGTSAIAWFELEYGAAKRADLPAFRASLEKLREFLPVVAPFDEDAAWHAGRVRAALEKLRPNALPIGPYDTLLAGHALSLGATLVTHNLREFTRVPGLRVVDWQD